jgi:hypothetical protein
MSSATSALTVCPRPGFVSTYRPSLSQTTLRLRYVTYPPPSAARSLKCPAPAAGVPQAQRKADLQVHHGFMIAQIPQAETCACLARNGQSICDSPSAATVEGRYTTLLCVSDCATTGADVFGEMPG